MHLFSIICNEERVFAAACGPLEEKHCTQLLLSERSAFQLKISKLVTLATKKTEEKLLLATSVCPELHHTETHLWEQIG